MANRDEDADGLLEFAHGTESAMDNSPVFRICVSGTGRTHSSEPGSCTQQAHRANMSQWASPDLSTWVANEMKYIALMADELGNRPAAAEWKQAAKALTVKVHQRLWDESDGFYYYRHRNGTFLRLMSVAGFWPLLLDGVPPARVARLLVHLRDPRSGPPWGGFKSALAFSYAN